MEEPVNRRVLPHRRPAVPWNLDHGAINVLWAKEAIARHRRRALRRLRRDALVALRLHPRAAEFVAHVFDWVVSWCLLLIKEPAPANRTTAGGRGN